MLFILIFTIVLILAIALFLFIFMQGANPKHNNPEMQEKLDTEQMNQMTTLSKKPKKKHTILKDIILLICIILSTTVITKYIGQRAVVKGVSMSPTLENQDNLLLDKISYKFTKPQRYDIVVFPVQNDTEHEIYIKRIIGLPGETVSIKDDKVYINDEELTSDKYGNGLTEEGMPEYNNYTLKENEYYCMGDNRENSIDSRYIGPVKLNQTPFQNAHLQEIIGKIRFRLYPLKNRKKLY